MHEIHEEYFCHCQVEVCHVVGEGMMTAVVEVHHKVGTQASHAKVKLLSYP